MYDDIKQSGGSLEPKAAIALIDHIRTEGEVDRMHQLLDELNDSSSWFDGCGRALLYCVQHNYPDAAIDLLKQLKEKDEMSTYMVVDQVFFYWSFWALGSLMTSDFHSLIKITLV